MKNRATTPLTLNDYFAFVVECKKRVANLVAGEPNRTFEVKEPFDIFVYRDLAERHESVAVYEVMLDDKDELVFIDKNGEGISEGSVTHTESVYPMALEAILISYLKDKTKK